MSFDFMEDAVDILEKSGDHYLLIYGRCGDKHTTITSSEGILEAKETVLNSLKEHIERLENE